MLFLGPRHLLLQFGFFLHGKDLLLRVRLRFFKRLSQVDFVSSNGLACTREQEDRYGDRFMHHTHRLIKTGPPQLLACVHKHARQSSMGATFYGHSHVQSASYKHCILLWQSIPLPNASWRSPANQFEGCCDNSFVAVPTCLPCLSTLRQYSQLQSRE